MTLRFKRVELAAKPPTRAHKNDAGWDLYALNDIVIHPCHSYYVQDEHGVYEQYQPGMSLVDTGIAVAIPKGYYGRVAEKSGLALKGIGIGAGVIDSGFRDSLKIVVRNFNNHHFSFSAGQKVAQLIITKISDLDFEEVDDLDDTERNAGGFGSSGDF